MNTIYKPKGAAAEYGDYAVNIYTGCPHRCYYCFAPKVLHREREVFHSCVEPRKGLVTELRRKLEREQITGKLVHLSMVELPGGGCATESEALTALAAEAKRRGISYEHLVANTTEHERTKIIQDYCTEKRRKGRRSGK